MTERQPGREADTECVCVCVMGVSIKSLINWLLLWGTNLDCRALWDWTNQEVINYTPPLFNCQSKPTGWREEMQRGIHTQAPAPTVSQHTHTHGVSPYGETGHSCTNNTIPHSAETHIYSTIIHSMPFSNFPAAVSSELFCSSRGQTHFKG